MTDKEETFEEWLKRIKSLASLQEKVDLKKGILTPDSQVLPVRASEEAS